MMWQADASNEYYMLKCQHVRIGLLVSFMVGIGILFCLHYTGNARLRDIGLQNLIIIAITAAFVLAAILGISKTRLIRSYLARSFHFSVLIDDTRVIVFHCGATSIEGSSERPICFYRSTNRKYWLLRVRGGGKMKVPVLAFPQLQEILKSNLSSSVIEFHTFGEEPHNHVS